MKNVRIHRATKNADNPYAMILKSAIEDERLSWESRGVLCYLLAKPDDWIPRLKDIERRGPAGRVKIKRIFEELISFQYIKRIETTSDDGRFSPDDFLVYESPTPVHVIRDGLSATGYPRRVIRDGLSATGNMQHTNNTSLLINDLTNDTSLPINDLTNDTDVLNNNNREHAQTNRVNEEPATPSADVVVVFSNPDLFQNLLDIGLPELMINKWLSKYGEEYIQEKYKITTDTASRKPIVSISGFFIKALKDDYKPSIKSNPTPTDPNKMTEEQLRQKYIPDEYANFIRG